MTKNDKSQHPLLAHSSPQKLTFLQLRAADITTWSMWCKFEFMDRNGRQSATGIPVSYVGNTPPTYKRLGESNNARLNCPQIKPLFFGGDFRH